MANLKSLDVARLPIPIRRSDDWTMNDLFKAYTGKNSESPTSLSRAERAAFQKALQAADIHRRLEDARALIKNHASEKPGQ